MTKKKKPKKRLELPDRFSFAEALTWLRGFRRDVLGTAPTGPATSEETAALHDMLARLGYEWQPPPASFDRASELGMSEDELRALVNDSRDG